MSSPSGLSWPVLGELQGEILNVSENSVQYEQ